MLLTLHDGALTDVRLEPLDEVRWCVCEIDVPAAADAHEVVELVRERLSERALAANGRLLAARVVLRGATRAHAALTRDPERWLAQFQACALDVSEGAVWLEQVMVQTRGALDTQRLAERDDALGQLLATFRELASLDATAGDAAALHELCAAFAQLKLPRDATEGDAGVRLDDPAWLAGLLPEVRELLLSRLLAGDEL
jgi:exonuclease SbcD